ncbi:MAG: hypothetical protein NTX07_00810 [Solirubrobacterales bacterium]|nr:hypothetical protein [Solirubrobacterales bacterium]
MIQTALKAADSLGGSSADALTESERLRVLDVLLGIKESDPLMAGSPSAAEYGARVRAALPGAQERTEQPSNAAPSPTSAPAPPSKTAVASLPAIPPVNVSPPSRESISATSDSRSRGLALIAGLGAVVLLVILLLWQPWSGNDQSIPGSTSAATTTTQTTKPGSKGANGWTVKAKFELKPTAGGSGKALAGVETKGSSAALLIAGNGMRASSTVGIWLTGPGGPGLVGFQKVNAKGQFSAIGQLPKNALTATQIIVTQETASPGAKVPTQPGPALLSANLSFQ